MGLRAPCVCGVIGGYRSQLQTAVKQAKKAAEKSAAFTHKVIFKQLTFKENCLKNSSEKTIPYAD